MKNNKKPAFVGDAVVEHAVRHGLYVRKPDATRDPLSKEADTYVEDPALAVAARGLDVGPLLELGNAGRDRNNPTVPARAFEAFIGAIYLDFGYPAAADGNETPDAGRDDGRPEDDDAKELPSTGHVYSSAAVGGGQRGEEELRRIPGPHEGVA